MLLQILQVVTNLLMMVVQATMIIWLNMVIIPTFIGLNLHHVMIKRVCLMTNLHLKLMRRPMLVNELLSGIIN